jgi:sensor histidine kinase YesM
MIKKALEVTLNLGFWVLISLIMLNLFVRKTVEVEIIDGIETAHISYERASFLFQALTLTSKIVFYYLHVYVLSIFFDQKKYIRYISLLLSLLILFTFLDLLISKLLFPGPTTVDYNLITSTLTYLVFGLASFAHIIVLRWRNQQEVKQQLTQEKLSAELQQLKAQINPHFLFNALNNLLSIAEKNKQNEISDGIQSLSDMLRFSLHEMVDERITLLKEVEFIENYIALVKLKYDQNDPIRISLLLENINDQILIAPALLFPFVENALKHGLNIEEASFVEISISIDQKTLLFTCKNTIFKNEGFKSGIGLDNVKRRLDILYKDNYDLKISEKHDIFEIDLKLNTDAPSSYS